MNGDINASAILKRWMKEKKIQAPKLAQTLEVSVARVYQWLNGERISALRVKGWTHDPPGTPELREEVRALAREIITNGKRD